MITRTRLQQRIDSWEKLARKYWIDFQATGIGIYQTRSRKYAEYAEIARMALEALDSRKEEHS